MTCVEVFAGMGAFSLGMTKAGYCHRLLVEKDKACVETLLKNGFGNVLHADVKDVDFRPYVGVDICCGGVPCQAWSIAGKKKGSADIRNLWPEALRCVRECQPRFFMFENSAAMLTDRHIGYLNELVTKFEELGFVVSKHVVNAMNYAVPQRRRRLLLIGRRENERFFPPPPEASQISVRDVFDSLGPPNPDIDGHAVHAGAKVYKGHGPSLMWKPSKALVSGVHGVGGGTCTVQLDDGSVRYYTPREMARLMTLPDDYILPHVWSVCVRQLGNACPVELVRRFASGFTRARA